MDVKSYAHWFDYSRARDAVVNATHTPWAPWHIAQTDDKKRGRLNIITHLLDQVPYEPAAVGNVTLPKRQRPGTYQAPDFSTLDIPTAY
jgi:hypothetical protein